MYAKKIQLFESVLFMKHLKCVTVSDGDSGQNELLITFTSDGHPGEYIPTVFDNYSANIAAGDQTINLQLWSTQGLEDYPKNRVGTYPQCDIFIILFSLIQPSSLKYVEEILVPEIKENCPGIPYILVGTKKKLRDDFKNHEDEYRYSKQFEPISTKEGYNMKKNISK